MTPKRGGVKVLETLSRLPRAEGGMVTVVGVRAVSTPSSTIANIVLCQSDIKAEIEMRRKEKRREEKKKQ